MPLKKKFTAEIKAVSGGGAYVEIPFDVEKVFGKKQVKIKATIDGEMYRGTLVRMGQPYHMLLVLKEIRKKLGKDAGDKVSVTVEEDTEPRLVVVPGDFQKVLKKNPKQLEAFEKMSYTHRKEYVRWIETAKHEETRVKRINKAIEMIRQGIKGV